MDMNILKIYYDDLSEAAKQEVLIFFNIKNPGQANLDEFPLFELESEEEREEFQ